MDYERVVLENLGLIDAVVRSIARRHRLSTDDASELSAAIRLKLVDKDYEVLRRFKEESSLRTYLTTVITRYFLDTRIAAWGKWRPSAIARRTGPHAVLLDQLLTRDGLSFEEAAQRVLAVYKSDVTLAALQAISEQLPRREKRRFDNEDRLADFAAPSREQDLIDGIDHAKIGAKIQEALSSALATLAPQDRIILRLRFCEELTVAKIGDALGLPQKPLYKRLADLMHVLRRELEKRGVEPSAVAAIVGHPATDLEIELDQKLGGKRKGRPSL